MAGSMPRRKMARAFSGCGCMRWSSIWRAVPSCAYQTARSSIWSPTPGSGSIQERKTKKGRRIRLSNIFRRMDVQFAVCGESILRKPCYHVLRGEQNGSNQNRKIYSCPAERKRLDTGAAWGNARRDQQNHFSLGDRRFQNLKIPPQNPRLHYFQTT